MEIKEIVDKTTWEEFITSLADYTFLQSWSWGEFNRLRGERIWRLGLYERDRLTGVCLVVSVTAKRGTFLFVPHGPLMWNFTSARLEFLVAYLVNLCREHHYYFIRISPWLESSQPNRKIFLGLGFRPSPSLMHTEETWLLDLGKKDERQLFSEMRKTTRNLVRRASREGVEVVKTKNVKDVGYLYKLQMATVKRHRFVPFTKQYLDDEFKVFVNDDQIMLFLARHKGQILAAAQIIFYGEMAFYFHSGSVESSAPVNYLLQWEVIREAKRRNCRIYNLWGVAPENSPDHPWAGLTVFKSGFGGYRKNYLHAQDLIISPFYWLTYLIEKLPRIWRERWGKI